MLVRLLYASRAAAPLTDSVVDTILDQSRHNNPEQGITGILCYSGEQFIQVLEGGRDEVCELFNAIVRDPRVGLEFDPAADARAVGIRRGILLGEK